MDGPIAKKSIWKKNIGFEPMPFEKDYNRLKQRKFDEKLLSDFLESIPTF